MLLLGVAVALLSACGGGGAGPAVPASPPEAVVAITFDEYETTASVAAPIMQRHALVGTFFVNPDRVDNGGATTQQLRDLQRAGWSIQAYSGVNMLNLLATQGVAAAQAWLGHLKREMSAKGFVVTSLAPAQRAWSAELRGLAQAAGFSTVRVAISTAPQAYPFPDPLNIVAGGTASLSMTDTAASLGLQLDQLQARGGAWIVVVHKVGDDADPLYSVRAEVFAAFCERIAREVAAGRLRVILL